MKNTQTQRIKARKQCMLAKKTKTYWQILIMLAALFLVYQVLNYLHKEDLKIQIIQEVNGHDIEKDLYYRDQARLARLTECNSRIDMLKEYKLNKQDIWTRCATIRTLSQDRLPYESIMQDIHTPSKSEKFWKIYYDIKRIRIENGIEVQTEVKQEKVSQTSSFDIYKLARAVAKHETASFTLWYGKTHTNWQGIKHGNTVYCPGVAKMKMCKFNSQQESHDAFVKIWSTWYGEMPNYEMAVRWSGNHNARDWLRNVLYFYHND